ncbi:MAG: flavin reductase family protein [Clostridia bacterium]|nr:flavin reductase family protein [Clostridia bacterium]
MPDFRTFDPCTLLAPVPAVMVSCACPERDPKPNIITIAWAGTVNSDPPMVSISVRKNRYSHALIKESGEFVVNLVDEARCRAVDFCGVRSGKDVDKWEKCGLTPMPALGLEHAPAIAECPAYLACKVRQVLELGSHDMFIGEVVGVQVRGDLFADDGSLHLEKAGLVAYNHGVYQRAAEVLGFFGYSVARPEVLARRMKQYEG